MPREAFAMPMPDRFPIFEVSLKKARPKMEVVRVHDRRDGHYAGSRRQPNRCQIRSRSSALLAAALGAVSITAFDSGRALTSFAPHEAQAGPSRGLVAQQQNSRLVSPNGSIAAVWPHVGHFRSSGQPLKADVWTKAGFRRYGPTAEVSSLGARLAIISLGSCLFPPSLPREAPGSAGEAAEV
jgi:hypothetical protein